MGLVDDDARRRHFEAQPHHVGVIPGVDSDRVPCALVRIDFAHGIESLLEVFYTIERKHKRKLFAREREFPADALLLDHEELRIAQFGARKACHLEDVGHRTRHDRRVELSTGPHSRLQLRLFLRAQKDAAGRAQLGDHRVVDRVDDDHRIFRRAARCIVEAFGVADLHRGVGKARRRIDDHRNVSKPHADRRRAGSVGRAHIGLRAGSHDQVGLAHELVGRILGHG